MAEELKACPFCGGDAESRLFDAQYFVQCVQCFNSTAADHDLESSAIAAWNTRAQASQGGEAVALTVWCGPMPESNGKSNFTAILMRKGADMLDGIAGGITIARSEYPDRVRYEADRMRYLIGELDAGPDILAYDPDKHSGYTHPADQVAEGVVVQEMQWLEQWMQFASEPIGQECCNRPGSECCGCPDMCYRDGDDIISAMHARREELRALLAKSEGPTNGA